ncbi:porin family protein [Vibrio anguillarum]|uniref:Porin family protein n=1 Tax=Vibrio anguillarum TaxID=55601 RepID=A0AAW4BHA3_VIBAN|nr:outer membrane beta-barrel protein [Vibrio anguillarum]MBF4244916.1 porin family protein [Vibrio anguillarum]MBF4372965.1 porin family protein [Vibrio anguillarum]MBF4437010.1 porin family protein [Vibrio anguillarum]
MTKKNNVFSLIATSLLIVAPAAMANTYMGLEFAAGSYNTKVSASDGDDVMAKEIANDLDTKGSVRIFGGKYLNDNVRVYGYAQQDGELEVTKSVFGDYETKNSFKGYELGLGADYLYHFNKKFYALAGGSLGYYSSEFKGNWKFYDDEDITNIYEFSSGSKQSGLVTNINLGLGYSFTEKFGMEAGWRLAHYSGNEHKFTLEDEDGKSIDSYDFKQSNQLYLNASYKF